MSSHLLENAPPSFIAAPLSRHREHRAAVDDTKVKPHRITPGHPFAPLLALATSPVTVKTAQGAAVPSAPVKLTAPGEAATVVTDKDSVATATIAAEAGWDRHRGVRRHASCGQCPGAADRSEGHHLAGRPLRAHRDCPRAAAAVAVVASTPPGATATPIGTATDPAASTTSANPGPTSLPSTGNWMQGWMLAVAARNRWRRHRHPSPRLSRSPPTHEKRSSRNRPGREKGQGPPHDVAGPVPASPRSWGGEGHTIARRDSDLRPAVCQCSRLDPRLRPAARCRRSGPRSRPRVAPRPRRPPRPTAASASRCGPVRRRVPERRECATSATASAPRGEAHATPAPG